jgi:hypothetical protein
MRACLKLLLIAGLAAWACDDAGGPSSTTATLVITVSTTGLDIDSDGYHVLVDGRRRELVSANGSVLTRLEPGSWTIGLSGLSGNCTIEGPASHTVRVTDTDVAPVEFAVVCTSTSGVVGVSVEVSGSGVAAGYGARLDGTRLFPLLLRGPSYLAGVAPGDHIVSLAVPADCSLETDQQTVTVTSGRLIRDTVEVTFLVACPIRPRDLSGEWRIIFNLNDQHLVGLATLEQGSPTPGGSSGISGTVTNGFVGASCYSGTITPGTSPLPSFVMGDSVVLEIKGNGTVVFRGTVSEDGREIIGRHEVFGGPCDGYLGGACLGRDRGSFCRVPPFLRRDRTRHSGHEP